MATAAEAMAAFAAILRLEADSGIKLRAARQTLLNAADMADEWAEGFSNEGH